MDIKKVNDYYVINDTSGEYYFRNLSTDKKHPQWKLFWYISPKDNPFEITGNINVDGNYVSIIINQGKYKRHFEVNTSNRSLVGYDVIEFHNTDEKIFPDKNYISVPIYNNLGIKIQDYFKNKQVFKTYNGEIYNGLLSSNKLIIDFIKANKTLGSMLDEMTKRKRRKK